MQSTALALMSCENKHALDKSQFPPHPTIPIYDLIAFCDLGEEPPWVYDQVEFIAKACEDADIKFIVLNTHLYEDYLNNFGKSRVVSIPFWTINEDGKKGKMMRNCTMDYKINAIQKYVRWTLLGYKKGARTKPEDMKAHEMHIGFSFEEKQRCKDNPHQMFINKFPLVNLCLERKHNFAYIKDVWGLETKASACNICPFHRNYFFKHLRENHQTEYFKVVQLDNLLGTEQSNTKIKSQLFISRSRKRIIELTDSECDDMETFEYKGQHIWNGF